MTESSPTRFWSRRAALAGLAASVAAPATFAQTAGSRPIRIIVGFAPGSANDLIARELARYMAEPLGQPVIVENKPGAGGSLGTEMVAKAAPDGLTIGLGTSSQMVMNVALYRNLPFDVERDLRQIGLVGRTPLVLAGKAAGAKKLKELIAAARANPGQISYGSGGTGSISHIVGEAFARAADIRLNHVPYKGNGPAMADLAGGHVDMVFDGIITSQPMAQQGRVRLLAYGGRKRSPVIPRRADLRRAGPARLRRLFLELPVRPRQGGRRRHHAPEPGAQRRPGPARDAGASWRAAARRTWAPPPRRRPTPSAATSAPAGCPSCAA
jgi:tripartite-type tricarboxylate transporter receptor subunit TctC